ncbi:MAG: hypothetical protein WC979_05375 [Candidatus Pacearchaeota archaeon]|jgi:hypothetical protein
MSRQTQQSKEGEINMSPKLNQHLINALSGTRVLITQLSIEEEKSFSDSPLNFTIPIKLDNSKIVKCSCCENSNTNWCWNCERPHCDKHGRAVYCGFMINTLCLDCAKKLLQEVQRGDCYV